MGISTGSLNRRLTILRALSSDDGTATVPGAPQEIGARWANKADVSDGERVRAAQNGQEITTRFVVRWDSLTRTIDGTCFVACEGLTYQVLGTKETDGFHEGIEITAVAKPDTAA